MALHEDTIKVNVTPREMIKPSSPTPSNKKNLKFSLFDQLAPNMYIPMLLFYQNDPSDTNTIEGRSMLLKKSLSEILVDFYPLAGRLKRNELIDCNDQGAEFCEVHVSEELNRFIGSNSNYNPSLDELRTLLPFRDLLTCRENIILSVQLNHFSCGGTAIGVCLHHKIADLAAYVDFLRAWGAKAAHDGGGNKVDEKNSILRHPKFNGASLFPPAKELNELIPLTVTEYQAIVSKKRIAMRRLIFDKKSIDELKAQAITANTNIGRPTRVEVVTAFICRNWPNNKLSSIMQVVNMRKRVVPPVPEDFFGNCVWETKTSEYHLEVIIEEFRKAIEKITGYLKDFLSSDDLMLQVKEKIVEMVSCPEEILMCNSLSGFPLYEVNFGMGNPVWVCYPSKLFRSGFFTISTECGQGIEAWVGVPEDDIAEFDHSLSQLDYPILKPLEIN